MPERLYASVNPVLLKWARETAGLDLEGAAKRIGTTAERLAACEQGRLKLTVRRLREAARVYKRPLATFFLSEPPPSPEPLHDFRRLPGVDLEAPSRELLLAMRRARRRHNIALELHSDLGIEPPPFPLRAELDDDIDDVAAAARQWIGVSLKQQQEWRDEYEALNGWMGALEARGILVFQVGGIPVDEVRGFSISRSVLPVIVVNSKDAPRARVFTLMHELTHLSLQQSGLCNPIRAMPGDRTFDQRVETYCNRSSGAILVPPDALRAYLDVRGVAHAVEWEEDSLRAIADNFSVSREVILFRLLSLDLTTPEFVSRKLDTYREEYAKWVRDKAPEGFLPVYRRVLRDNGRYFTRLVLNALDREQITLADVSDFLGVQLKHLDRISDEVEGTVAARG